MTTNDEEGWNLKFAPFSSVVDSPFWVRYSQEKLDRIKLSEDAIEIRPTFGLGEDGPPKIQCQEGSLQVNSASISNERVVVDGKLIGFNTKESFQKIDKNILIHDNFCPSFFQGDTSCLNSVLLLTFPDLKHHKVLYWFAFPALLTSPGKSIRAVEQQFLDKAYTTEERLAMMQHIHSMRLSHLSSGSVGLPPYFILKSRGCSSLSLETYKEACSSDGPENVVLGFFDPNAPSAAAQDAARHELKPESPIGWPLRNLVAYLSFHLGLGGETVKILSYRPKRLRRISTSDNVDHHQMEANGDESSILLKVKVPLKEDYEWETTESNQSKYRVVGWELNARSKPGPRSVNLRPLLDSKHLAIQAADLNLKLMKWRMIPQLQVEKLQSTKVLIIGAGTLGCNVARVLLGWGVRSFKFVDYGKVSYSNPVRQPLFTLDDCHAENGAGRPKSVAAAEALKAIAADVESEGLVLSIPMPGHVENKDAVSESVNKLDNLMQECDVCFLLTDTRESRWLPTVMAAAHDKVLINAALGLDNWLVMRHGGGIEGEGTRLGCYFCNDIVAPENSTKNRTLDQQCTVTRPGLAPIASSMAVEMMVSLLHHSDGSRAPAPAISSAFSPTVSSEHAATSSPLGVIPHQVRGSLVSYTMMNPTVPAFQYCTACSARVVDAFRKDAMDLVYQTCKTPDGSFLEEISGLSAFRAEAAEKMGEFDGWDDDE